MSKELDSTKQNSSSEREVALMIVKNSTPEDRLVLSEWAEGLLALRELDTGKIEKAKKAISLTLQSKAAISAAKIITRKLKKIAWDDRSIAARFGLGGAAAGLAVFGSQGAGIVALGTGVGVPLWVVLGAGSSMAGVLLEELTRKTNADTDLIDISSTEIVQEDT